MSVDHPYDTPTGSAGENPSSTSAKDQAQQAAGTAAEESKHVAGVARTRPSGSRPRRRRR